MNAMADRVALVTGGSSGIGRATALAFAAEGARVVIASRTQETGEAVVAEIGATGGEAIWVQTDVSKAVDVEALVARTMSTYGRLDYAFNNAGSGGNGGWLTEIREEDFDQTIAGYLKSCYLCMQAEIPAMLKNGGGVIVNNSSVDGQRAFPWDPIYSAAKHGVLGLTKSAAVQYIRQGIRINAICPSWIATPPVAAIEERDPGATERLLQHQPIGRLGDPREVADTVVWLCSDRASFIVGTAIAVDGGYLAV